MKVLYVDDEADIREVAELALGLNPGWEVRTAASGREALTVIEAGGIETGGIETGAWAPDVMLLDVMMPQMDGPQTLEAVRRARSPAELPVIFITARVLTTERARLMSLGAAGVIAKPFDPMRLGAEVSAILAAGRG